MKFEQGSFIDVLTGQLDRHGRLVVLVEEPLILVNLRLLEDKVHDGLLDGEEIVLLDLLVRPLDLPLVLLQPLGHHRHDALEPPRVDARHIPRVDAVVNVVVIPCSGRDTLCNLTPKSERMICTVCGTSF